MVPRKTRLRDAGRSFGKQGCEQQRRFDLRTRYRRSIGDRVEAATHHGQGRKFTALASGDGCPHFPQRLNNPPHWATTNRFVACQYRKKVLSCEEAGQETNTRSGIPAINRSVRLGQPPESLAIHTQFLDRFIDGYAKRLECTHRIEAIFASAIARNRTDPVCQRCQDYGAMGDRLIARDRNRPLQRSTWCDGQRRHRCAMRRRSVAWTVSPVPALPVRAPSRSLWHRPLE